MTKIYFVPKIRDEPQSKRGLNCLSVDEVNEFVYFEPQAHGASEDVTLVLGYDDDTGTATSILLCRFHKFRPFYGKKQSVRALFKDLHGHET